MPCISYKDMPKWHELSVKSLWTDVKEDCFAISFFPDFPRGHLTDVDYFYPVINTIYPGSIDKLVLEAQVRRNEIIKKPTQIMRTDVAAMYEEA